MTTSRERGDFAARVQTSTYVPGMGPRPSGSRQTKTETWAPETETRPRRLPNCPIIIHSVQYSATLRMKIARSPLCKASWNAQRRRVMEMLQHHFRWSLFCKQTFFILFLFIFVFAVALITERDRKGPKGTERDRKGTERDRKGPKGR